MALFYFEFSRDPRGAQPAHLCPSAEEDVADFLATIADIRPQQLGGGAEDAWAVVRLPWPTARPLTAMNEWRDGLAERSLRVTAVEHVVEFAEVRTAGRYWRLEDRGNGWKVMTVEDHGAGELVARDGTRDAIALPVSEVGGFARPVNE